MWAPQFNTRFLLIVTGVVAIVAWIGHLATRNSTWAQTLIFVSGALVVLLIQFGLLFLLSIVVSGSWRMLVREARHSEQLASTDAPSSSAPSRSTPSPFAEHQPPSQVPTRNAR